MPHPHPFVGRKAEIEQFEAVLIDPAPQAVLVVGQQGMGKTLLVNKLAEIARHHPGLNCGAVRHEITKTDSVDACLSQMLDDAFDAAQVKEKSFDGTKHRLAQWRALLNVVPGLGELSLSLRRDPQRNSRDQFIERMQLISDRMPDNSRAIFVIDPEKYMQPDSEDAWTIVVRRLPPKIKLVFAQRPDDALINYQEFTALNNVVRIPGQRLDPLADATVEELIPLILESNPFKPAELRTALSRYGGHPYAVAAALALLADGLALDKLPSDPTPTRIAAAQWTRVKENHGSDAVRLFEAYAVLEVPVPDDVVEHVADLPSAERKSLLAHRFLAPLTRSESGSRRIYHTLLADHIRAQLSDDEAEPYHRRAIELFRQKLERARKNQTAPDPLAAERLAEHVLAIDGVDAFVGCFVNECTQPLVNLGRLDAAIDLSNRALELFSGDPVRTAMLSGNLGVIHRTRGDLDRAEEMFRKSLEIEEKLGRLEGMASDYGNLGVIHRTRGDLDQAEEMHRKALEINEELGRLEGMASDYGNLGLIHRTRGDLDQAEEMHRKAFEINEKLGRLQGMAIQYGNLGLIHGERGDLDQAEEMHRKALKINMKLGRLEGMAIQYGNLGLIYSTRGDLDQAEKMHRKSLEIEEKLGRLEGMASDYGNLGTVAEKRG
ncbi:MAG: tetratricopeptide repeat protein, partial [bacterium]|nr:tetratricopeptide repeat protein [bacterium]